MTESHPIFDTFIFDLDGTILDTMPDLIHATNETLTHFGYPTHTDATIHSLRRRWRATPDLTAPYPKEPPQAVCAEALEYWKALHPQTGHARTRHYAHMPVEDGNWQNWKAQGCKLAVLSNKYEGGVKDDHPANSFPTSSKCCTGNANRYSPQAGDPTLACCEPSASWTAPPSVPPTLGDRPATCSSPIMPERDVDRR